MRLTLICLTILLGFNPALANTLHGIIIGKYANMRTLPSVHDSRIITKAYHGAALRILDKSSEKTTSGNLEGYWYKIELIEEGETGWVFDKYVGLENSPRINEFIQWSISSLYYYRSDLDEILSDIKKRVTRRYALDQLKRYDSRFLNYIGYRLLAEKSALAIPVLITFMDTAYKSKNQEDANYQFTWEILQRLTPDILISNNVQSFRSWWQRHWGTIQITPPSHELALIFKHIVDNENRAYRNLID